MHIAEISLQGGLSQNGTIVRKAYTAKRQSGKTVRVKASRIKDRGAPGKWTSVNRSKGIGKLRPGTLSSSGYNVEASAEARHKAIERSVKKYGALRTLRRLNAVATYTKRTSPTKSRKFKADVKYVQSKYF